VVHHIFNPANPLAVGTVHRHAFANFWHGGSDCGASNMPGTAPRVGTVRAFGVNANSADGTTFNILNGLDWAADEVRG
jgi:hypothetical protein